ncbi:hypothetical protein FHETE_2773 [Fusarium heterosporum]|uniref:Uncharacterized protein n=1 Tax=Fusarium heterosporum TaxID=42747 RepID=A0A8H5TV98_FUSHE|nr:hypothetical protein FHETE_2773 [Fusarium heterosporum]
MANRIYQQIQTIKRALVPGTFSSVTRNDTKNSAQGDKRKLSQALGSEYTDNDDEDLCQIEPKSMYTKVSNNDGGKWVHILDVFAAPNWKPHLTKAVVLDSNDLSVTDLLSFDAVICSLNYLKTRSKKGQREVSWSLA